MVYLYSTIKMMHSPINLRLELDLKYSSHLDLQLSAVKHFLTYCIPNDMQRKLCAVVLHSDVPKCLKLLLHSKTQYMKTNFVAKQNDFEVYFSMTFHMKLSEQERVLLRNTS